MLELEINNVDIAVVDAGRVRPMRQRVLRPHQSVEQMIYSGDDAPGSFHLAAQASERVLGIASFYLQPHPLAALQGDWRLRGMAVEPALQGKGLGGRLVQAGLGHICKQGGSRLWCNARVSAQRFYEKLGFVSEGDAFDIRGIGSHYVMSLRL